MKPILTRAARITRATASLRPLALAAALAVSVMPSATFAAPVTAGMAGPSPVLDTAVLPASADLRGTTVMLPAGSADQVPSRLAVLAAPTTPSERAPLQFSWAIDPGAALAEPLPYVAESREYWREVDAAELRAGVAIATTAPRALVRVSPEAGARAVDATQLRVTSAGQPVATLNRSSAATLQAAGLPVADGVAAVQLAPTAPAGEYRVQLANASGRYVMHVFEPDSPIRLTAALGRDRALAGSRNAISVALLDGSTLRTGVQASALLVAPGGRSWPVDLRSGRDGLLRADVVVPADAGTTPGLWEVQVFAADGTVQRDARTAFAVAQPTARLSGAYAFDPATLGFRLPLEAGSAGRFEARGTLYATGPDRVLRPVAVAHSAAWLEAGKRALALAFDPANVPAGYGAPYELRDVELNDQSRLAPLERRARVARVTR